MAFRISRYAWTRCRLRGDVRSGRAGAIRCHSACVRSVGYDVRVFCSFIPSRIHQNPRPDKISDTLLANGFGVVLIIITNHQKIILSRRSDRSGVRPREIDVSVVEALPNNPILDRSTKQFAPDLYHAAIRSAQEELGIELVQDDIFLVLV